jgi:hypothetical protein
LVAREKLALETAANGKSVLLEVVAMTAGLIARFSGAAHEDAAVYGARDEVYVTLEKEKEVSERF